VSGRASSELLLVGSLPAQSTDEAFRAGAELFGDLVFALPDGETGPRAAWVGYERERLVRPNPGVDVVQETDSPTGIPRHAYETPVFKIRPGVSELQFKADFAGDYPVAERAYTTSSVASSCACSRRSRPRISRSSGTWPTRSRTSRACWLGPRRGPGSGSQVRWRGSCHRSPKR
jgi:hypothetical protein